MAGLFGEDILTIMSMLRLGAPKGGTAVYYKMTLCRSPEDVPPLYTTEVPVCRVAVSRHGTLIIVSVYLPPSKRLLRSNIKTLLALGDAVILFGDLNYRLSVLLRLGSFTGEEQPSDTKIIIDWKRVSTKLEEVDTLNLNVIPDDIVSNKNIATTIGALIYHIKTVVGNSQTRVPATSICLGLPADVQELISAKNAYPTPQYRSRAHAFQRHVRARIREVKNEN
ncbi:hypothetical protein EVAR_103675_1 [Eumeta japonica]|uniref:RNA-directed DNA polymerase from mobile element jockey n=1 Tax=Eumeta variegata TaxID=151549 RepID=A0A4C1Z0W3_EUMVA|nr:hypothetical protein EVAR_103675_1 [Eumeta japonica]